MPAGVLYCGCPIRTQVLCEALDGARHSCAPFDVLDRAGERLAAAASNVEFAFVSLREGDEDGPLAAFLEEANRKGIPSIVEIDDDSPARAFRMLELGAFHVISSLISETEKLRDLVARVRGRTPQPLWGPLLSVNAQQRGQWGFMSMNWDVKQQVAQDYWQAIYPTMRRLNLALQRADELYYDQRKVRERIRWAISERPVLVAQLTASTEMVMHEITVAESLDKQLLLLRREGTPDKVPVVLADYPLVEYTTMTELAMRLYFGLREQGAGP